MPDQFKARERRDGLRIPGKFFVRILGEDTQPRLRAGDIGIGGIYFESFGYRAEPGTVERLEIRDETAQVHVTTLAVLVRVTEVSDLYRSHATLGVAFHFLPTDPETWEAIRDLVLRATRRQLSVNDLGVGRANLDAAISAGGAASGPAVVRAVQHGGIVMETEWPIEEGAVIRLAIEPTGAKAGDEAQRVEMQGVVRTRRTLTGMLGAKPRYRLQVAMHQETEEAPSEAPSAGEPDSPEVAELRARVAETGESDISDAIEKLIDSVLIPARSGGQLRQAPHLEGDLSRVGLFTVVSLVDMERMSGSLRIEREGEFAVLYAQEGQVVDATFSANPDLHPRDVVTSVLGWSEGLFRFSVEEIEREDRIGVPTHALLLDSARVMDESGR